MHKYKCESFDSLNILIPKIYEKLIQINIAKQNARADTNSRNKEQSETNNSEQVSSYDYVHATDNSQDINNNMQKPNSPRVQRTEEMQEKIVETKEEKIKKVLQLNDILNKMYLDELQKLTIMKDLHKKLSFQDI
jgi:hypothetical protein